MLKYVACIGIANSRTYIDSSNWNLFQLAIMKTLVNQSLVKVFYVLHFGENVQRT